MATGEPNISQHRNFRSLLIYFFGFLLFIPFASLLLLQNISLQQIITQKIATRFSHQTGINIKFEKVQYTFFHKLQIRQLILTDSLQDTLLIAPEVLIDLQAVFFNRRQLVFNQVVLHQPDIRIKKDTQGILNWKKLIGSTSPTDTIEATVKNQWSYRFRNVIVENAAIKIDGLLNDPSCVAWHHTHLTGFVMRVRNLLLTKDQIEGRINRLGFLTHTGFHLLNLSTDLEYKNNEYFHLRKLSLVTSESDIDLKQLSLDLSESLPLNQLPITATLNMSKVSLNELGYFLQQWKTRKLVARVKGEMKGNLNDLRIKNLALFTNEKNYFKGNIRYTRLPEISEPYLYLDVKEMRTAPDEVQRIINWFTKDSVTLPETIKRLAYFYFKGNFTGFPSDFVALGTLHSPIGSLKLDISLKPSSKQNIGYNGTLEAIQFQIGELIGKNSLVGPTHLTLTAQGNIVKGKDLNGTLTLEVHSTTFNGYPLHNLIARGTIENKVFQGKASINDPNLQIETSGHYSLYDSFPAFNFSAQIKKVNLLSFNILPLDSIHHLQATVEANFSGNSINEFDGRINIKNILLINPHNHLNIKSIDIHAFNNEKIKATTVSSELFDMQVKGEYQLGNMVEGIKLIVKNYIPSAVVDTHAIGGNDFTFQILLKNPQPFFNFFYPSVKLADSTLLSGVFRPVSGDLRLDAKTEYFQLGTVYFDKPIVNVHTADSTIVVNMSAPLVYAGGQMPFTRLTTSFNLTHRFAQLYVTWYDSLAHLNEIRLKADSISLYNDKPRIRVAIEPSTIFIRNEPWSLSASSVLLDTATAIINHFRLNHETKEISINGRISRLPDDSLLINFKSIDLSFLNYFLQSQSFHFDGNLDGVITVNDFYRSRNIAGNLKIQALKINQTHLGNIQIATQWNSEKEAVHVYLTSSDATSKVIAQGNIYPLRRSYQFDLSFNRIELSIIEPILSPTFHINDGYFTGHLKLTDEASRPVLNGEIELNDARIQLTALHTTYNFSNTLVIDRNTLLFKDFVLYDENQHPLHLNGQVRNNYLKNFTLDFTLIAENNLVFDKAAPDDLPFYGKAFASGKIHVYSNDDFITVDITQGKTEENSLIIVALGQTFYSGTNDFVYFAPPPTEQKLPHYNTDQSASERKKNRLLLNMDLDVTTQAELQLLLSANRGDMLKGRGNGSIKFEMDKAGNFFIRGQYTLTEGTYNFTMNNLMNKKFDIQSNSTIYFNGRPGDASIDITAIYHTRAPLYNLFAESNIEYRKRIPVDCQLFLTGRLLEPNIRLSIDLPNATEETKSRVRSVISSEQEMSQQFLALLLLNNFMPTTTGNLQTKLQETNLGVDVAATTSLELLSSQLSSWVSSFNKDFDLGVSYRPGDQVYSYEDLEIALSTQLLNNRMIISSNVDFIGQSSANTTARQSSAMVGDVNVEYRLTDRVSLKAFNRANDILYFQDDIYTRGIGIIYREEFTNLKELTRRYFKQKQKGTDTLSNK